LLLVQIESANVLKL